VSTLPQLFGDLLVRALPRQAARLAAPALPGAGAALTAAALARRAPARFSLAITPGPAALERVYGDLCALGRDSGVIPSLFPQQQDGDSETAGTRLRVVRTLSTLASTPDTPHTAPSVIVTSIAALLQPVPDPDAVEAASVHLAAGKHYAFDALVAQLVSAGYERAADVDAPGRLAVRGGLLDVWPPAAPLPWRAEFFDTELESLRTFDPASQCSVEKGDTVWLPPCSEQALPTVRLADLLPQGSAVLWLDHDAIRAGTFFPPDGVRKALSWEQLARAVDERVPWLQLYSGDPPPAQTPALELAIAALPGLAELGAGEAHHPELLAQARQRLLDDFERRAEAV